MGAGRSRRPRAKSKHYTSPPPIQMSQTLGGLVLERGRFTLTQNGVNMNRESPSSMADLKFLYEAVKLFGGTSNPPH